MAGMQLCDGKWKKQIIHEKERQKKKVLLPQVKLSHNFEMIVL